MGELTASLSHQLNQPLTAITSNALAALRFLDAPAANLVEVRDILRDIVMDAQRASDVTVAVRDMLRKDKSAHEPIDVNEVVRDTASLIASEAAARGVTVELVLAPSLPLVDARPVQLRQVILNLMMNGLEAVAGRPRANPNHLTASTRVREDGDIQVSVIDTGCGLPDGREDQIFEPLFTTKPSGMGMGLPIARAIVDAHGGVMWAESLPGEGAAFHFTLPDRAGPRPAAAIDATRLETAESA
jgi:two-component system sensor kinase FixL